MRLMNVKRERNGKQSAAEILSSTPKSVANSVAEFGESARERERGRERAEKERGNCFFLCSVPKGRREWERVQTKGKGKGKGQTDTILSFLLFLNAHTHIPIPSIRSHHIQSFSSKIHKFINKSHTHTLSISTVYHCRQPAAIQIVSLLPQHIHPRETATNKKIIKLLGSRLSRTQTAQHHLFHLITESPSSCSTQWLTLRERCALEFVFYSPRIHGSKVSHYFPFVHCKL